MSAAGPEVLAALGCRRNALGVLVPPHPDTIARVFAGLGAQQLAGSGHGRTEKRTIQVMDAPEQVRALFPHARQVFLIERYVTRRVRERRKNSRKYKTTEIKTAVAALCITSLSAREAAPEQLAGYVRRHWHIENKSIMSGTLLTVRTRPGSGPRPGRA